MIDQNDFKLTQELHLIRAHLLHYGSLLNNFQKSVEFIRNTPNCAMTRTEHTSSMDDSKKLLSNECDILIDQLMRLEQEREMQELRLRNVMNLVSSFLNLLLGRCEPSFFRYSATSILKRLEWPFETVL